MNGLAMKVQEDMCRNFFKMHRDLSKICKLLGTAILLGQIMKITVWWECLLQIVKSLLEIAFYESLDLQLLIYLEKNIEWVAEQNHWEEEGKFLDILLRRISKLLLEQQAK